MRKFSSSFPTENCLLLIAGTGWSPDEIGTARLAVDDASPAGYALSNGSAALSNHLEAELRFHTPQLLLRHEITRAINVPIRGVPIAFGVLEADSPESADFPETDILFLKGSRTSSRWRSSVRPPKRAMPTRLDYPGVCSKRASTV